MDVVFFFFFFFQAEDGIRDLIVTGVQTCALPISPNRLRNAHELHGFRNASVKASAGRSARSGSRPRQTVRGWGTPSRSSVAAKRPLSMSASRVSGEDRLAGKRAASGAGSRATARAQLSVVGTRTMLSRDTRAR